MKETELKPYDEYEKEKSDRIIATILQGANYFEHYVRVKPTVFMSHDVLSVITRGNFDAVTSYKYGEPLTVCGYDLKMVFGNNVLYFGYELSMPI